MAALQGALLSLLLHPELQIRAQAELDEFLGRDRLPDFSDRAQLTFVNAICREVLRMYPVLPLALAHGVLEDDVYEGWFIPKGVSFDYIHDLLQVSKSNRFAVFV